MPPKNLRGCCWVYWNVQALLKWNYGVANHKGTSEAYNDQGDIIIDHPLAMLKLKNITPKLLVLVPFCLCKGSVETYVTFIHFPQTYCKTWEL